MLSSLAATSIILPSIYFNRKNDLKFPVHLTYIFGRETIIWIGEDYIKRFPNENNKHKLIDLLTADVFTPHDKKIQDDYNAGRVAVLDGWLLSITEGRQCALYSLTRTF
jgi:hypothetical protein